MVAEKIIDVVINEDNLYLNTNGDFFPDVEDVFYILKTYGEVKSFNKTGNQN